MNFIYFIVKFFLSKEIIYAGNTPELYIVCSLKIFEVVIKINKGNII